MDGHDRLEKKIEDCGSYEEHYTVVGHASQKSSTASNQAQYNNPRVVVVTPALGQKSAEDDDDDERRRLLVVARPIRDYKEIPQPECPVVVEPVVIAAHVAICDRPSIDDIACIVQEYRYRFTEEDCRDDENQCSDVCCSPANSNTCKPACKFSFRISKLQKLAVRQGIWRLINFWTDGLSFSWRLAFVLLKIFIYLCLLIFTVGSFIYNATERRSVIPFDIISFILVVIGKVVTVTHAFLFIFRHQRDIRLCCTRLCHPICGRCRRRHVNPDEAEEDQRGLDEAETYVMHMEQKLNRQKGKCAQFRVVIGNFSELLLTIVNDVLGTVVFIMSLYSFVGGQHYALFYGDLHWSHFFVFGYLVFSTILLLFATHAFRVFTVGKNIYRLDKKVDGNTRHLELPIPNTFCKVMLSFQWRLVAHVALSSVFQLYAVFALSWKIIQDNCSPVSHPVPTASSSSGNGTVLPFVCDIPQFANGYTIYNILYIAIAPTVLGLVTFFVSNAPSFVEYMQLVATSSYRQMERLITEEHDGVEGCSPITELVKGFCSDLDCSFSIPALNSVEQRARTSVQNLIVELNRDASGSDNYFIRNVYKLFDATFFLPAFLVGTLHLGLFLIHICFMTCTAKGCFDTVSIFSIFQHHDANRELLGVVIPLAILFLLASFPGPWISLFWLCLPPVACIYVLFIKHVDALRYSYLAVIPFGILFVCIICRDAVHSAAPRRTCYNRL